MTKKLTKSVKEMRMIERSISKKTSVRKKLDKNLSDEIATNIAETKRLTEEHRANKQV